MKSQGQRGGAGRRWLWWGGAALSTLGLIAAVGPGCDGARRVDLPRPGEVVQSFPAPEGAATEAPKAAAPLEVSLIQPAGVIYNAQAINVSFSEAMVADPVAASADGPPFRVEPPVEGRFQWLGDRTASLSPSAPLPTATAFTITVPAGLKSLKGGELSKEVTATFQTPGLKVIRHDPSWYNARLKGDDQLYLQFNLPVEQEKLAAALRLTRVSAPRPTIATALTGGAGPNAAIPFTLQPADKDRGGDAVSKGTAFWIKPDAPFASDQDYRLSLDAGLLPTQGQLGLDAAWSANFKAYGPFLAASTQCGWGDCVPGSPWTITFSNPVKYEQLQGCLKISPPVALGEVSSYYDSTQLTLYPKDVKPGAEYKITVSGKCQDTLGNALARASSFPIKVGHHPPRVQMNRGVSFMELPAEAEKILFPITLRNTPDVNLRMARLTEETLPNFLKGFESWWGGDTLATAKITPDVARPYGTNLKQDEQKTYAVDLGEALGQDRAGVVFLDVQSDSYDQQYGYGGNRYHKSLVQVTDIGLTAKYSPESCLFWTTSLATAAPLAGVRVALRTLDGELLWEGKSDADGIARAPGIKAFGGKEPRLVFATRGAELSFLDREDWEMQIAPYNYGLNYEWDAPAAALRGHIFTERGVYRPGEEVHIKAHLRVDRGRTLELLPGDRARVRVTNSQSGVEFDQEVALSDLDGLHATVKIPAEAPLGTWSVEVRPVGMEGVEGAPTGAFRVDAYRAPDFEVQIQPDAPAALVGERVAVKLSGQYLFGAPMSGAKVGWGATRRAADFRPVGFDSFEFGDHAGSFWWSEDSFADSAYLVGGEGKLDAAGLLPVELELKPDDNFKGAHEVVVEASVTDANRQVVSGQATLKVHPADFYVGLRREGYLVESGKDTRVEVVTVGVDGQPVAGRDVKVELLKRNWSSIRKASAGGGYTWVTETEDKVLHSCPVRTRAEPTPCAFSVGDTGYYVLRATSADKKGRAVETTTSFYAWGGGWSWWGASDDEKINLVPDKETYKIGQKARVMVQSPFREARALVTVERRGILTQQVLDLKGSANTIEVPVTEEMLPNAYLSVTLIRGRVLDPKDDGQTIDPGKPAFKMGYIELKVDQSDQHLAVNIQADRDRYRPGDTVTAEISIKDAQGQPASGELTFMAVDEGVLSLTGYKTPNPVAAFFQPQPIAVISAESRRAVVAKVKNAEEEDEGEKGEDGGDGGGEAENYRAAFATTAAFEPLIKVGNDGRASVSFRLPDNLTAFRLMAVVAGSGNRFGSGDTRVQVQKPLLVRPSLPRFNGTGDDYLVSAVIQSVGDTAGKVRVEAEVSGPVELIEATSREIDLQAGQVREVTFPARVAEPGEATFRFRAWLVEDKDTRDAVEIKLPVRFPAAQQQLIETGVVRATGKEDRAWKQLQLPKDIRPDVGGLDIEIASSALADLMPGLDYLVGYPYGCVEQTTGRTLPLVAMRAALGDFSMPGIAAQDVTKFAQAGLERLWTMQTWEGGLGYWPGDDTPHPWGSVYGGLALVLANEQEGLEVDPERLERLLDYLRNVAHGHAEAPTWYSGEAAQDTRAFAAYVLAEAGQPEESAHTALYEKRGELSWSARALLAMSIHRAEGDHQMVRDLLAEALKEAHTDGAEAHMFEGAQQFDWETMDSAVRTDALVLMALTRTNADNEQAQRFARGLLNARRGGHWISTQENAFAVVSLLGWFQATEKENPSYTALVGLGEEVVMSERMNGRVFIPRRLHIPMKTLQKHNGQLISLTREGGPGPLYYNLRLRYVSATPPQRAFDNGFTIRREYVAHEGPNAGQPVQRVKPGEVVRVNLTLVIPEDRHYVAIEDPLPAGLEPINTNFATTAPALLRAEQDANQDQDEWERWWYNGYSFDHIEQRDDRVLLFADFFAQGVYSHSYLARATTPGRFTAPAARVEEMYHPEVFGHTEALSFEIAP
jgi:uncharacterized protein YfaS (alpha-2-macroglobulin family)